MRRHNRSETGTIDQSADGRSEAERGRLRNERDPDELVEEATQRLREILVSLDARDEWGRPLGWRQVVRIALGPMLQEIRDARTITRLTAVLEQRGPDPLEIDLTAPKPPRADGDRPNGDGPSWSATGWPFTD